MSRRLHGRVITAAALTAALALASPVHAASRSEWGDPAGWFQQVWQWIAGAGPGMGARSHGQTGADARPSIIKEGAGIEPQGECGPGIATGTTATSQADRGAGTDPDG